MCSCGNETGCIGLNEGCRCVCHIDEIRRQNEALRALVKGQEKLLVCYRLQTRRGVDAALDEITEAKIKLGWT